MSQFDEMETFVRIVEAGSITKAAEQMNTVKSAISRKLANLETRLKTSLLKRTTRKQSLTDTGRQYYHHCLRILNDIDDIEGQITNSQTTLAGRIKLTVPLSYGLNVLSPLLISFAETHPQIELNVDFSDRKANLIEDGYDLAIRISKLDDSNFIARKIAQIRLLLCASPSYTEQYGTPKHPNDLLSGHYRLHYSDGFDSWHFQDKDGQTYNLRIPGKIIANNGDFLSQAAVQGLGLTYTPDFIVQPLIDQGKLIELLPDYTQNNVINAYAIYPYTRHLTQRVRVLISYLHDSLGN